MMKNLIVLLPIITASCIDAPTKIDVPLSIRWQAAGAPPGIPGGPALFIAEAAQGHQADEIVLAVRAHKLQMKDVSGIVCYDPMVLHYQSWGEGEWFSSGVDTITWTINDDPGSVTFNLTRHGTLSGGGEILLLHFIPTDMDDMSQRSTIIGWQDPLVDGVGVGALGGAVILN